MATALVPRRQIGTTGIEASVLALGSWHTYDRIDFRDGVELLRRAVDAGIDLYDVGVYGGIALEPGGPVHHSYTDVLFARMIEFAGVDRDRYLVSEKLWLEGWPRWSFAEQLDRALYRIGSDRADFAILGDVRTPDLDFRRLVGELGELVASGRLGGWGVNNWSVGNIRTVHELAAAESLPGPQLAQLKYSVCRRAIADGEPFAELFRETGMTLEASDVLEGGILVGKPAGARMIGRDPGGLQERMREVAPELARIAGELDATPAQLGIAFCLGHPSLTTVLFGVSRIEQLEENLGALELHAAHGDEIRARVEELWLDRGIVDPNGP